LEDRLITDYDSGAVVGGKKSAAEAYLKKLEVNVREGKTMILLWQKDMRYTMT
jgi:hypothetical protein